MLPSPCTQYTFNLVIIVMVMVITMMIIPLVGNLGVYGQAEEHKIKTLLLMLLFNNKNDRRTSGGTLRQKETKNVFKT